ncbi:azurin [Catalinimonas alkaloidigena]|uniref:Azurin n=1 Tax=Catalinimonas alkaloidigena TaxID=1075417 RepID=A0A1G9HSP6_9BACT|nr:plastocyanin/azurin family copper-binding protein [Catalinimonas alkaloidigena]SDL16011.1 azurin [Catalinimonas alkaloidigena]
MCKYRFLTFAPLLALLIFGACANEDRSRNTEQDEMVVSSAIEDESTAAGPVTITVRAIGNNMAEMDYDQEEITVPAGAEVTVTLVNEATDASMVHNIVFVEKGKMEGIARAGIQAGQENDWVPDNPVVIAHTKLAKPGESVTVTFTAPAAGEYEFVCTYPGHWQKMNGKFIVKGNA